MILVNVASADHKDKVNNNKNTQYSLGNLEEIFKDVEAGPLA